MYFEKENEEVMLQNAEAGSEWQAICQHTLWVLNSDSDGLYLSKFWIKDQKGTKSADGCEDFEASAYSLHPDFIERLRHHYGKLSQQVSKHSPKHLPPATF